MSRIGTLAQLMYTANAKIAARPIACSRPWTPLPGPLWPSVSSHSPDLRSPGKSSYFRSRNDLKIYACEDIARDDMTQTAKLNDLDRSGSAIHKIPSYQSPLRSQHDEAASRCQGIMTSHRQYPNVSSDGESSSNTAQQSRRPRLDRRLCNIPRYTMRKTDRPVPQSYAETDSTWRRALLATETPLLRGRTEVLNQIPTTVSRDSVTGPRLESFPHQLKLHGIERCAKFELHRIRPQLRARRREGIARHDATRARRVQSADSLHGE